MADILQGLRAWWPHDGFRRWGSANKQVFVYQSWPSVCQKSIYLPEQGGRSRPGLRKWVSGRLSPSALSQLGMRVLHHPTWSVTSAGRTRRGEKKRNGVSCTLASVFQDGFGFTSRINSTWAEEAMRGLLLIKVITAANTTTFCRHAHWNFCEINNTLKFHFF